MQVPIRCWILTLSMATGVSLGEGLEVRLVPVGSTGAHVIDGTQIMIPSGPTIVELEIQLLGLQADDDVCLYLYLISIDPTGYSSRSGGSLTPAQIPCRTHDDCFGSSYCVLGVCDGLAAAFIDHERADFVFHYGPFIFSVDHSTSDYRYMAAALLEGFCPRLEIGYCGTLILGVPKDARGTFTVGFLPDPDTWFKDLNSVSILPLTLTPALITIRSIDLNDFARWPGCMTGPGAGPYGKGCEPFDFNADGDVDLEDFASAQTLFVD